MSHVFLLCIFYSGFDLTKGAEMRCSYACRIFTSARRCILIDFIAIRSTCTHPESHINHSVVRASAGVASVRRLLPSGANQIDPPEIHSFAYSRREHIDMGVIAWQRTCVCVFVCVPNVGLPVAFGVIHSRRRQSSSQSSTKVDSMLCCIGGAPPSVCAAPELTFGTCFAMCGSRIAVFLRTSRECCVCFVNCVSVSVYRKVCKSTDIYT